jgi:hypothetical protein
LLAVVVVVQPIPPKVLVLTAVEMVENKTPLKDMLALMAPEVVAVDQAVIHQQHQLHQEAVVLVDLESL